MGKLFNIQRIYSRLYDLIMIPADRLGMLKWRKWATSLKGSKILEIGVGTGLNMPYYNHETTIFAVDPDAEMLKRAVARCNGSGHNAHFIRGQAETLPFSDAAFDAAVGTLVFCTVADQERSLSELNRVVKPGAPIRLFEHVRLDEGAGAHFQDLLTPVWKGIAGGCRLNRKTPEAVKNAGFRIEDIRKMAGAVFVAIDAIKR